MQLAALWLCFSSKLFAQPDTTTYQVDAVEILDQRQAQLLTLSTRTDFRPDSLGMYGAIGVSADAVLQQAAGVYIKNYGGHGGVKTLSLRGFAAQQTTVSINGIPYQNPQSGTVNFGNFFPEGYSLLRLDRGASSAAVNPQAGNIDFRVAVDKTALNLSLGSGSFGEKMLGVGGSLKMKRLATKVGIYTLSATDDFDFSLNGESGKRQHAAFQTKQYQWFSNYKFQKNWEMESLITGYTNVSEIPGPVLQGNPGQRAGKLNEDDSFISLKLQKQFIQSAGLRPFSLKLSLSNHYNFLEYSINQNIQKYAQKDLLGQISTLHLAKRSSLESLFQLQSSDLEGNNLAIDFVPIARVSRLQFHTAFRYRMHRHIDSSSFKVDALLRFNQSQDFGLLPNAALGLHLISKNQLELFVRGNIGQRIPAFNELYYFGFGNAHLRPERAQMLEIGFLQQNILKIPLQLKLSIFLNHTLDKIISIPISPARWSTRSIGHARSQGAELALSYRPKDQHFHLNYSLQKAINLSDPERSILPYTPSELLSYGWTGKWKKMGFNLQGHYSGWRFSLVSNSRNSFLPAYHLLDAGWNYDVSFKKILIRYFIQFQNILDTNYQVIHSYPMPRRSFRMGMRLRY